MSSRPVLLTVASLYSQAGNKRTGRENSQAWIGAKNVIFTPKTWLWRQKRDFDAKNEIFTQQKREFDAKNAILTQTSWFVAQRSAPWEQIGEHLTNFWSNLSSNLSNLGFN